MVLIAGENDFKTKTKKLSAPSKAPGTSYKLKECLRGELMTTPPCPKETDF